MTLRNTTVPPEADLDQLLGTVEEAMTRTCWGRRPARVALRHLENRAFSGAPWTYDEILIAVPAQQHTPVARPKSPLTGKDVKVERTVNWGPSGGKQ